MQVRTRGAMPPAPQLPPRTPSKGPQPPTLLAFGAASRLAIAGALSAVLWIGVLWAIG